MTTSAGRVPVLRVLVLVEDEHVGRTIQQVIEEEGDRYVAARSIEQALKLATSEKLDVAFVELRIEGGATLALCHHLPGLSPNVRVHMILQPEEIGRGPEALSLGASGVLLTPLTGDAIARALSDAKADDLRRHEVAALEAKLTRERKRLETYDRLVRFARGAVPSDAVRAIVEGVSQLSAAQGVALYATFGDDDSDRLRLAALGSAIDFPSTSGPADLSRMVQARAARVVPLVNASGPIGLIVLDRAPTIAEPEIAQLADLASAMLSLVDRNDAVDESVRIFSPKHFRAVANRLLSLAQRHDRRCSVLAISLPGERSARREETIHEITEIIRTTDALSGLDDGKLLLFLPETSGLGAQACRRRILARLLGDRRARPTGSTKSPTVNHAPIAIGVATFPHDATTLHGLVQLARSRSSDDARSPVHALSLESLSLQELVDALLARPMLDAGPRSSYPLDVACSALFALAVRTCKEAQRSGDCHVTTTLQPGLGLAAAARQTCTPRVHDVRAEPGCSTIDAIVVEAEHGAWVCCGRIVGDRFQGVHAADPLLADIVERHLSAKGNAHAG